IVELLNYCRTKPDLQINLYTNGVLLEKYFEEIVPLVDFLSLSIDGSDSEKNAVLKGGDPSDFDRILRAIKRWGSLDSRPRLQVITLMSRQNVGDIEEIGRLLEREVSGLPDFRWKINYYSPMGRRPEPSSGFEIYYEEFEGCVKVAQKIFPNLDITYSYRPDSYQYLILGSQGDLLTVVDGTYVSIGNLLTGEFLEDVDKILGEVEATKRVIARHLRRDDLFGTPESKLARKVSVGGVNAKSGPMSRFTRETRVSPYFGEAAEEIMRRELSKGDAG
ncbi:radical SAM protein, partial [Candidatus Omnitrophota bacterium]